MKKTVPRLVQILFIDDAHKIFGTFVHRWREEFGVRDIKEEDIDEQDKKVNIYLRWERN
jgi:hypothetical protein